MKRHTFILGLFIYLTDFRKRLTVLNDSESESEESAQTLGDLGSVCRTLGSVCTVAQYRKVDSFDYTLFLVGSSLCVSLCMCQL